MQLAMHMVTIEDLMPQEHFLRKLEATLDLSKDDKIHRLTPHGVFFLCPNEDIYHFVNTPNKTRISTRSVRLSYPGVRPAVAGLFCMTPLMCIFYSNPAV